MTDTTAIDHSWGTTEPSRSVERERVHRKQRLVGAFRIFGKLGFEEGLAGHITARDPEHLDCFWVNRLGVPFSLMTSRDLVMLREDGTIVDGTGPVNQAAFAIHSEIHRARPDVVSAAHSHSVHSRTWSTLGRLLDPITQDVCAFYGRHSLYDDYEGVVVSNDEAARIAEALGPTNVAVILRNHGLITVGSSVDAAIWNYIAFERSCQVQIAAEAAGRPIHIRHEVASAIAEQAGAYDAASFQPIWLKLIADQPDILD